MKKMQIELSDETNQKLKVFTVTNGMKNIKEAARFILKEFLNSNQIHK